MQHYKIVTLLTLLLGIAVIIAAQFSIPVVFGADGYLHIRMAEIIRQYGPIRNFHWARYSVFANNFADKDFLYHLILIPFTFFPNIFFGAKVASCVMGIFLLLVFFRVLKRYCLIKPLIPAYLVALLSSAPFLLAVSNPRNMILIITLTLIFIHLVIRKNQWGLFLVTVTSALLHVSGPFLLLFALMCEAARFINEKEFSWRSVRTIMLGLLLGYVIHPNFPRNLLIFYLNGIRVPIFALKWGLELGAEFYPLDTRFFVLGYPFIFIGLLFLIAAGMSSRQQVKTATKMWMCIAGFFFAFSFFSQRYIIHGYPLMLIASASYFSDWWASAERLVGLRQNKIAKRALTAAACLVFLLIGIHTYKLFREFSKRELIFNRHYEAVGKWMSQNIPAGDVVFHANWSDSQYFIGLNPADDYFVTLDPIFMYAWDLRKYNLYRDIAFGRATDPYKLLKEEFGVQYGYAGKNYFSGLINQVRADARFAVMAEDGLGVIFRLKPAS